MIQDLAAYLLTGLIVAILIPWACLETASFFSSLKQKPSHSHHSHWLWAAAFLASLTLAGCAGGSKDDASSIVAPKTPSGAGATRTEGGEAILPGDGAAESPEATAGGTTGGATSGGTGVGTGGATGGPALGEPPVDPGTSPALIMQVVNTILN